MKKKKQNFDKSAFHVRESALKFWHLALIGACVAAAILVSVNSNNDIIRGLITIIITLSIIGLLYLIQNRGSDLRTATEFQAMVYAGAMRMNNILTLILYRNGSIFYLDSRYAENFTNGSQYHNLDQFLSTMGLENENKIQVYDAIRDLTRAEFEYVYKAGRKSAPLKIGVYPLVRPEGFVVMTLNEG